MTCQDCEAIQDKVHKGELYVPTVFVRVGNANVEIVACRTHAAILVNAFTYNVVTREGGI